MRGGSRKKKTKRTDDVPDIPETLTQKQAWHVVALIYEDRPAGICTALDMMEYRGLIDYTTETAMQKLVLDQPVAEGSPEGYRWPVPAPEIGDRARRDFADEQSGWGAREGSDDEPDAFAPKPR